jgi:hypothetical protein
MIEKNCPAKLCVFCGVFRLLVVFVGIVMTISGCNGLLSSQFGTHRLREVPIEQAVDGVGDSDYVRVRGAQWTEEGMRLYHPSSGDSIFSYLLLRRGAVDSSEAIILWSDEFFERELSVKPRPVGMVESPSGYFIVESWNQLGYRVDPSSPIIRYGRHPLAWYWNVAICAGGLALALGTEAAYRK